MSDPNDAGDETTCIAPNLQHDAHEHFISTSSTPRPCFERTFEFRGPLPRRHDSGTLLTLNSHFWKPVVNLDKLWTLIPAEERAAYLNGEKKDTAPVIDLLPLGYSKLLGKGRIPQIPVVVKARWVSELVRPLHNLAFLPSPRQYILTVCAGREEDYRGWWRRSACRIKRAHGLGLWTSSIGHGRKWVEPADEYNHHDIRDRRQRRRHVAKLPCQATARRRKPTTPLMMSNFQ